MIELKAVRLEKGVTIAELARRSGLTRQTIYKIEGGCSDVNTRTLKALADALGVKITDFFVE